MGTPGLSLIAGGGRQRYRALVRTPRSVRASVSSAGSRRVCMPTPTCAGAGVCPSRPVATCPGVSPPVPEAMNGSAGTLEYLAERLHRRRFRVGTRYPSECVQVCRCEPGIAARPSPEQGITHHHRTCPGASTTKSYHVVTMAQNGESWTSRLNTAADRQMITSRFPMSSKPPTVR